MTYEEFLRSKIKLANFDGFDVPMEQINPALKPHTRDIVQWAVKGGNRAIFASFGLHKTATQLEILRLIQRHRQGLCLNVMPLGVRQEFFREVEQRFHGDFGMRLRFIRSDSEIGDEREIYLTNYESVRESKVTPALFRATSLDEASILRSYGSKTYQEFLPAFAPVEFKFVATATPSPNRYKELIHYAGYLGVMDTGQALTRFFQRDSEKAGNLTLYPHKEHEFWLWVASWAVFIQRPSDLGHSDEGYVLPELDVRYHEVPSDYEAAGSEKNGQGLLIPDVAMGLSAAAAEKRDSLPRRIEKMMEVIDAHVRSSCATGVQQGVLPEEPGADARGAKGAGPGAGGCAAGGANPVPAAVPCCTAGRATGAAAGTESSQLCGEQACVPGTTEAAADRAVRIDAGAVQSDLAEAGAPMPDLSAVSRGADGSLNRPLPCDGIGSGGVVPEVQRGVGYAGGESGQHRASDGVPEHAEVAGFQQVVIWCDLNAEQDAIEAALTARGLSFSSIYGSLSLEECESRLEDWKQRRTYALIGKPVMLGQGLNLQQANTAIFIGVTYKFNDLIQAVHRIQRFGQTRQCLAHIVHTEAEREVLATLKEKWAQHDEMQAKMSEIIRTYGLTHLAMQDTLARTIGVQRRVVKGDLFEVAHNDCVLEAREQPENSVGLIVTSIPFANHYEYSPSYNDFGHTEGNEHFWAQMDYLTPELLRILKPGRIYACHVKDRINFGNVTGAGIPTVSPFHAEALFHGLKHGFDYMGMITVVTDVVRENNQTYRLGYTEMRKDGTKMGVGSPEYVLLFHKPQTDRSRGYADEPVRKTVEEYSLARWQVDAHALWRSNGDRFMTAEELAAMGPAKLAKFFTDDSLRRIYDFDRHVAIGEQLQERNALPSTFMSLAPGSHHPDVWHDINRMRTLNGEQTNRAVEKHVCPLQFDIVDRLILRYSNKGDVVYDPFHGLGTVGVRAIKQGRRAAGSELNAAYFADQVHYLQAAEREVSMPSLFDLEDLKEAA
jgi:DNA modification methylase